jgi:hypothetical protein
MDNVHKANILRKLRKLCSVVTGRKYNSRLTFNKRVAIETVNLSPIKDPQMDIILRTFIVATALFP